MATDSADRPATLTDVEITPAMIAAGLRVLRNSGALEYEMLVDELLVERVLSAALGARPNRRSPR